MIPSAFEYVRADSIDEALSALAEHGDDAKVLAGGMSLLPLMKLRLAAPALIIDTSTISELSFVRQENGHCVIGAMTRYCDVMRSTTANELVPLLTAAIGHVGDPQVRHRGTIGGATAHGDPAGDVPAALACLEAEMVVRSTQGSRTVAASDFFRDFLDTDVGPDELLTEIRIPVSHMPWSFQKFVRRAQDWAVVGVAATTTADGPSVALINMAPTPVHARGVEAALRQGASAADASQHADEETSPVSDTNASGDYRRHLSHVLVRQALEEAGLG